MTKANKRALDYLAKRSPIFALVKAIVRRASTEKESND